MEHIKLYSILNTFTSSELTDFRKFLASPFYNQNENVLKLFNEIKVYHPDYSSKNLKGEKLHLKIYPGAPVNCGTINNLITKLINLAEKFLSARAFNRDESLMSRLLLKEFDSRKLDTLFTGTLKKTKALLRKQKIHDEIYYEDMYSINEVEFMYERKRKPLGKLKDEFDRIPLSIQYLLYAFYLRILCSHLWLLDSQQHLNIDESNLWVKDAVESIIKNVKVPYNLLLDIYIRTVRFAEFKEEYNIDETLKLIFDNKDIFPPDRLKLIISPIYNYCKDKEFAGDKSYGLKSLNIIKLMVEKNLILNYDASVDDHEYVNYASAAVKEKDYQWAEDFTNNFKNFVAPARREDAFNYNHAVINYIRGCDTGERKYFESALEYLSRVNASDFYYKTRIFLLSMNIFYEISETETLLSLIDSFKHYMIAHKSEIPPQLEERYLNFANFLIRLVNLRENPKLTAAIKLKRNIDEKEKVEFRKRLIGKIDDIIKENKLELQD